MDDRTLLRYAPGYAAVADFTPKLDWSDHPGPLGGMLGAVEMCNNNGACRAFDAGVMCPSFRTTRDEQHLTRGRANTLRLALTGQLGAEAMQSEPVAEAMKLCVSCKACRRECPTGVDMAKMKIEVLAAQADRHGVGRREHLVAELPRYGRYLSRVPWLANARNRSPMLRRLMERHGGVAADRSLPEWSHAPFRDDEAASPNGPRGAVFLLADTFNRYFEPENLRAALRVLQAAGYGVVIPRSGRRAVCCGRTFLAAGMVDKARDEARRTIHALTGHEQGGHEQGGDGPGGHQLGGNMPVLGLEPSCLFTLRDEFRSLLPGTASAALAGRAMLLSEFLAKQQHDLTLQPLPGVAHVHGHCHQKSFGAFPDALATLQRVPDLTVRPITSSCCGMAGAFGYQAETQDVSRAMAEAGLLPAVRAASDEDFIVADGTSCRHQIRDLSGREAVHSVRLLDRALPR
jgi:Fe-S oxidoreductase